MDAKLPLSIVKNRKKICGDCKCDVDFSDPCASCPKNYWKQTLCIDQKRKNIILVQDTIITDIQKKIEKKIMEPPTATEMAKSAIKATAQWAARGFVHTDQEELSKRIETCRSCEFWNPSGFGRTGRCMKCGCSTWAKLRMATEKCPIGKW